MSGQSEKVHSSDRWLVNRASLLLRYFELLDCFDEVDTNNNRRIERAEFDAALPLLAAWGVPVADADAEFDKVDVNKGGFLLFDEFSGCMPAVTARPHAAGVQRGTPLTPTWNCIHTSSASPPDHLKSSD